jgi:hypothetical protein
MTTTSKVWSVIGYAEPFFAGAATVAIDMPFNDRRTNVPYQN